VAKSSLNEYSCSSCGWVYRASEHDGLDLFDQPEGWSCPQCQADFGFFDLVIPTDDDLGTDDAEVSPQANIDRGPAIRPIPSTPDIETLYRRWKTNKLDTQPDFQRYEVWPKQKQSRLVESVLLGLPIPLIYLAEEQDGKVVVIDGQQRLTSLFHFLDNEYPLSGLGPLKPFEKKKFKDLEEKHREAINNFSLFVVTIAKDSDPDVRFTMFERLNEGATKLNEQELRNSVYRGEYNNQLKDLATTPEFLKILRQKTPHKRMVDIELVLRFMAFHNQTYLQHPDKRTKEFLNMEMEGWEHRPHRVRNAAIKAFKDALSNCLTVYGEHAFRPFSAGRGGVQGKWEPRINRALYDVQMYGLRDYPRGVVTRNANAIFEASLDLMADPNFSDLISHTISEKRRIKKRFEMWTRMLEEVVGDQEQGPRLFNKSLKQEFFASNPLCNICGQAIAIIDDAHLDHVLAFRKGGKTQADNAALTHRYCNMAKQSG
jgi:hypothetical protein